MCSYSKKARKIWGRGRSKEVLQPRSIKLNSKYKSILGLLRSSSHIMDRISLIGFLLPPESVWLTVPLLACLCTSNCNGVNSEALA